MVQYNVSKPIHSYLDNDKQLVVGCEEVSLRGVERSLVLPPLEAGLGTAARDALHHCRLTHLHLHTEHLYSIEHRCNFPVLRIRCSLTSE
jgi:hypothetical protein